MFGLDKITPEKVLKAGLISAGACVAAIAAPIGAVAVVGITVATAATTWAAESIDDELKGKNNNENKS
ncbi:hypothetical protein [Anabaena sp. PCC 7108]|uniref:hypothetical protein n=1 Tax=Anabaena sp. PCC 7108 TaxID=163908 RepID=UPI00034D4589|nr:hypothetical protein [Anabaena sp. PCC 7108]